MFFIHLPKKEYNMTKINIYALVIAMKREKNNSVIFKKAKYIHAKRYNLSPNTFSKYLKELITSGLITELDDRYVICSLSKINKLFFQESDYFFGSHAILHSNVLDCKIILKEIEQLLVFDNVFIPQVNKIENNKLIKLFIDSAQGTDKNAKSEWFKLPFKKRRSIVRMYKKSVREKRYGADLGVNVDEVVTSCRHLAEKIGVTKYKANKILNYNELFKREIRQKWFKGCNFLLIERLKLMYPKATIIPCPHFNKVKVCEGSYLTFTL